MAMPNMEQFALNMIQNSPKCKNNKMAQELADILKSHDNKRGEEMANNLLQTYGSSKEDGIQKAKKFFGF